MPFELLAVANARELVPLAAEQKEAAELAAMRLEEDRLEALDLALLLKPRVIFENFAEYLDGLTLTASHRKPKADE
jgi:hypothetical protein